MQRPAFTVYDASAGSGKTYTLVKEYLKIIIAADKPDAYRNILAITFTNKAVHEMKSRIVENLMAFTSNDPSAKVAALMQEISDETDLDIHTVTNKSRQIIRHIIHNYAAFDISTIDKFTHRVIRAFAHDLNLPITFEVSVDTENLLAEAVDSLIAQAGEDETLTKLLVDFTIEKTDDDKSWDISREILETGRLILNENNRSEIAHFTDKSIEEFVSIKKRLQEECRALEEQSVALANEALTLIESHGIEFKSFYSGYIPNHFRKLSAGDIIKNISHYKYLEEIECKRCAAKTPQAQKDLVDKVADQLLEKLRKINDIAERYMFYMAFLKNLTPLSLLNTVSAELSKIQQEQNILSIAEFNKLIYEQIQNQPAPFIYERMGERYRHFFIDEFQDTSEMQWQNLIPLINNATSSEELTGERGSLMIVGDPKQSIYRWRGGKAEQFIALGKDLNPFNNPEKEVIRLEKNFRSHSQVIDFNNAFFRMLSEEFQHEIYRDLYENHSHQQTNSKTGGYVSISFIPPVQEEAEESTDKASLYVQAVLKTVKDVRAKGFSYSDIVILTRKREHGTLVANYLATNGIRVLSSETLMIDSSKEVKFLVSLLRFLKNAADPEPKALMLLYIAEQRNKFPVHDFIAEGLSITAEADFQTWLNHAGIDISFESMRRKSIYEAVETAISRFIGNSGSNAYIQYFLDIVLERDVKGQSAIADFLDYWDKNCGKFSIPVPESTNGIRIMTIHKSKGLEFPVVIFPFAEEDYGRKPKDKLWLDSNSEIFGLPRVLIDNSSAVENFGDNATECYRQKKEEELLDNVNVLYVALTRAEEQLYIISSMNLTKKGTPPANSTSGFLIKYLEGQRIFDERQLEYVFGSPQRASIAGKTLRETLLIEAMNNVIDPQTIKIAKKESLMWGTRQQEAIEYGNVVHEILSFVKTENDIPMAVARAIEDGLITLQQREMITQTLAEIVTDSTLADFFSDSVKVLTEQVIISKDGPLLKPDRMVLCNHNEVLLLDYKTGSHQPKYISQMETYQQAIERMGYSVTRKVLVYIGKEVKTVNL
ncbi:MAG TPA: UvrD-helicase domain-containing protein [Flavobacterium sp.]|jgi:ATP-dependent exoDNAse (exonuclease V) beta subunit